MQQSSLRENEIVKLRALSGYFELIVYNQNAIRKVPDGALVLVVHVEKQYDPLLRFIGFYDGSFVHCDMFATEVEQVPDCVKQ
jgi:hypothetical protein